MTRAAAALLVLFSCGAQANGFIDLSLGAAWREPDSKAPFQAVKLDFDTGTVARLELGTRYESGLMLRVAYAYTAYDAFYSDSVRIAEDIAAQDARFGVFHATPPGAPLGWRLGGGYVYADEDDSESPGRSQRGGFVEVAAVIEASRRVTLELAGAAMKLGGEDDYDAEGAELRGTAAFHTRVMDFTLGARYAQVEREFPFDEQVFELRVGIGGRWAYPEGARY